MRVTTTAGSATWVRGRRLVDAQDLDPGRGEQDPAEGLHQPAHVLARAAVAHPLELVEVRQLDLELERGAALTAGQRDQQPGVAALLAGGLDLLADEVDRALPVRSRIDRLVELRAAHHCHRWRCCTPRF